LNVIAPDGAATLRLDVTVATKLTVSFATAAFGDANSVVVLVAMLA
jgi:hypothetical protein